MNTSNLICYTCRELTAQETKYNKRGRTVWSKCLICGTERDHAAESRELRRLCRGQGGMNHGHLRTRRARSGY